jgi:hypothetical protein
VCVVGSVEFEVPSTKAILVMPVLLKNAEYNPCESPNVVLELAVVLVILALLKSVVPGSPMFVLSNDDVQFAEVTFLPLYRRSISHPLADGGVM